MGIRLVHSELRDFLQRNTPPMVGGGYENQALPLKPDEVLSRLFTDNIPGWLQLTEEISENVENAVTVLNDLLNYDKIEVKYPKTIAYSHKLITLLSNILVGWFIKVRNSSSQYLGFDQ